MPRKSREQWRHEMRSLPGRTREARRSMIATLMLAVLVVAWLTIVAIRGSVAPGVTFATSAPIAGVLLLAAGFSVQRYDDLRAICRHLGIDPADEESEGNGATETDTEGQKPGTSDAHTANP